MCFEYTREMEYIEVQSMLVIFFIACGLLLVFFSGMSISSLSSLSSLAKFNCKSFCHYYFLSALFIYFAYYFSVISYNQIEKESNDLGQACANVSASSQLHHFQQAYDRAEEILCSPDCYCTDAD
mmetsp:Transcript_22498/g.17013  ORF Transcript_22498/g.17013 Transcript_22498/m.17013 type:complete len:125 (+) Transcript_22498:3-377(+)